MFPEVVAQDQWALERQQQMMEYPDDGYSELFLKTDKALRRARQILMGLQRKERELQIREIGQPGPLKESAAA
jgi:vanillate O-demethylase monooxygenase subunit